MYLEHTAVVVDDYDRAIDFFVNGLGFELAEDSPDKTTVGGRPKRWVVVRPPGAATGLLLAQADGPASRPWSATSTPAGSASSSGSTSSPRARSPRPAPRPRPSPGPRSASAPSQPKTGRPG